MSKGTVRTVEISDLTRYAPSLRQARAALLAKAVHAEAALAWADAEVSGLAADEVATLMGVLGMSAELDPVGETPRPEVED